MFPATATEKIMAMPLFHQRSHSMPVGNDFINNTNNSGGVVHEFKRSSPLKVSSVITTTTTTKDNNEHFPLPTPKSIASHEFHTPITTANTAIITPKSNEQDPKFFSSTNSLLPVIDMTRKNILNPVLLECKMDRGFFVSQSHWTCYRRNYFQVTASFIIPGHTDQATYALHQHPNNHQQQESQQPIRIQQFYLRLKACTTPTAATTINTSKPITLTQMTPKRDKGPQREPPMIPITPSDSAYGCEQICITFERLQFRVATANNGKRRASQQYFSLVFELVAELGDSSQHVVLECYSSPLVVRGRSPGHYSSDQINSSSGINGNSINNGSKGASQAAVASQENIRKKRRHSNSSSISVSIKENNTHQKLLSSPNTTNMYSPSTASYEHHNGLTTTTTSTLPIPHYVYAPPPMIMEQQARDQYHYHHHNTATASQMPFHYQHQIMHSNNHTRSQSANDTDYYARRSTANAVNAAAAAAAVTSATTANTFNNSSLFEQNYQVGIERALNWQQQINRQRTDSAATFDSSFIQDDHHNSSSSNSSNTTTGTTADNHIITRPSTPIPYNNHHSYNNWNTTTDNQNTFRHHYIEEKK